jgi:nicotinamidase-related amidase
MASVTGVPTALIVIDVQEEYFTGALQLTYPDPVQSLSNIVRAMDAARRAEVPVVLARHTGVPEEGVFVQGTPGWEMRPEVMTRKFDRLLEKRHASAFQETDLAEWLGERNIDQVALAGYMTQHCIDATSRHSVLLDIQADVLSDATGTLGFNTPEGRVTGEELHRATLVALRLGFARILSTEAWIASIRSDPADRWTVGA